MFCEFKIELRHLNNKHPTPVIERVVLRIVNLRRWFD